MRKRPARRHGRPEGPAGRALTWLAGAAAAILALGGTSAALADAQAASNGLVPLPCGAGGALQPVSPAYCLSARHYVTPQAREALLRAAGGVARTHPGAVVRYMEGSWASAKRPMPPHVSHGDGRQIDLAIFYEDGNGRLRPPPTPSGYGAFEPPRRETERVCVGAGGHHAAPDPPARRSWRLAESPTAELIRRLSGERQVRRIFIEPHLKRRLGFAGDAKVRFAGCGVARHDDHLHVDFR